MTQDTATSDNVFGAGSLTIAAGLANPQYGFVNYISTFGLQTPDGDFYNLGNLDAGFTGRLFIGGALDELSAYIIRLNPDNTASEVIPGNGLDGKAIIIAGTAGSAWELQFTTPTAGTYLLGIVDQIAVPDLSNPLVYTGAVTTSVPYVISATESVAAAQTASYNGGSNLLGGTSGAEGSFVFGSTGGEDLDIIELIGADGLDNLIGGSVAEIITGLGGNDILAGGGGDDVINGNLGDDDITGGLGNDTLSGNGGADEFALITGFGQDVVTDFNGTAGDRVSIVGDLASTADSAAGLVITLTDGASITLTGITSAAFNTSWILDF